VRSRAADRPPLRGSGVRSTGTSCLSFTGAQGRYAMPSAAACRLSYDANSAVDCEPRRPPRTEPGRVSMKYSAQSAGSGCEPGTASHRRSRWRLRSGSSKSSNGVRECTIA
jgi:hypothetical protein